MLCHTCGHDNSAQARFCEECGGSLTVVCASCAALVRPEARFCDTCGHRLAGTAAASPQELPVTAIALHSATQHGSADVARSAGLLAGERKQVTVLSCDIVESTKLTEELGAEAMHVLLGRFFERAIAEVRRYEGRVSFRGDGFLAIFGAPMAYEDHARRAVLAALGIQRGGDPEISPSDAPAQNHPLQLRIGLDSGFVVVGNLGNHQEADYTAVGDTANVAARLGSMARPETILISEATARQVRGYVRTEALGATLVRGKTEPISVYRVVGMGRRRSPFEGTGARVLSPFVGRERQLDELHRLLGEVEAGRGQVVNVVASGGLGKSRLVYEFRRSLSGRRLTCLEGRCLSYGSGTPYSPILEHLRSNCGIGEAEDSIAIVNKVRLALEELGMDAAEWAPYLLYLLGIETEAVDTSRLAELIPEAIQVRTFETLRQMALRGSRRRPLIFVVEDLHWIDRTSEEYFATLVDSLADAPILLLCTYRPRYQPPWIDYSYSTHIFLQRLAPQDSLSIVRFALEADNASTPLIEVILGKAEGNPFFLEELSRALVDRAGSNASEAAFVDMAVPDTVQGVLMARIDRLPKGPRRLLQTASVLGREFTLRLLRAIWTEPATLESQLLELRRLGFIYERSGTEEPVYVFKHALTQDVAYDSMLVAHRKGLHASAGRALEVIYEGRLEDVYDRLVYHYTKTDEVDQAARFLTLFGQKAARAYANADAAHAFEEALAHLERVPAAARDEAWERRTLGIVGQLAHSLYFLRRIPDTLDLLRRHEANVERRRDPAVTGPYYFWLAHTYSYLSDYERASDAARRAIAEAEHACDNAARGKAYYVLARIGFGACRFREGVEYGQRAARLLEEAQEWLWLGMSYWAVGLNLTFIGRFDEALEAQRLGRSAGELHGDLRVQTYADWATGWILTSRGDCAAGLEACRRSLTLSRDAYNTAAAHAWLGHAYLELGDFAQAIAMLEQAARELREAGYTAVLSWIQGWLGEAYLLAGQIEEAGKTALEGISLGKSINAAWPIAYSQRVLARIAVVQGATEDAARLFHDALRMFTEIESSFEAARTHCDFAVLLSRSDLEAAMTHVEKARELFAALRISKYVEKADGLAASIAGSGRS